MNLVQVDHLSKHYGPKQAVADVSFTVERGEILGLLGPNGAGKSTTLRILSGYLPPSSGAVTIAGFDILTQSLEARRHLGYLPESVPLYTEMTARDYLAFIASARGLGGQKARRAIGSALEECHIEDVADTIIGRLSKGYRQRVGLAQAILHNPDVLVLDEPTVGLDPRQIADIRSLIRRLGEERAVILSSHILPEVSMVCQRIVIINQGRVIAEDSPDHLVARLEGGGERWSLLVRGPEEQIEATLRSESFVRHLSVAESGHRHLFTLDCEPGDDLGERLSDLMHRHGWAVQELRTAGLSLEDVFLNLTTIESDGDHEDQEQPEEAAAHARG
ncbi:MAG: ATP-binding cassette domain-containing protein [Chloroflexi bacterium]|nr:ATP-binding cassette domain-containing protein [Chloroflexota bacterium]